jgi:hypothetical protein
MKAIVTLLFLLVGSITFADEVRIDPAYVDDGVYLETSDEASYIDGIYNGEIDDPAIIQVLEPAGTASCTRNTPVGIYCYCNQGIRVGHPIPGWQEEDMNRGHYVRPGWHVRNIKGMHGGGKLCIRDREPTPEERARFKSGHFY